MDTQHLNLVSPIPPSVNHYLAYRAIIKNGRAVCTSYCTTDAKKYKADFAQYVKGEVEKQGWKLDQNPSQHFYADTVFYFSTTASDANNCFKCMLDAITDSGMVWIDDNVVCERVQGIFYDSENPRVEICIHPVEYIGIFPNRRSFEAFEERCKTCSRFSRNCSLLRKAKEGRIQNDVSNEICTKYNKKGD
jgi:crossover junction endodeoxyribonuclease RusA